MDRSAAWEAVGNYYGWDNLDAYPVERTARQELAGPKLSQMR
jgi:hypothetical protein